jgi:hypothetical protein
MMAMVAAAATIWLTFTLWIAGPSFGLPRPALRISVALLVAELVLLLAHSYGTEGCDEPGCAPLAQAAGVAARADVPLLAALLLVVTCARSTLRRWTVIAPRSSRTPGGAASGR